VRETSACSLRRPLLPLLFGASYESECERESKREREVERVTEKVRE
jgi:hypothetical protein